MIKTPFLPGSFYRGNLHLHTIRSDGELTPEQAKALYKSEGYSFIAITDHRRYGIFNELYDDNFVVLTGCERDTLYEDKIHHIVSIGTPSRTRFTHEQRFVGRTDAGPAQNLVDDIVEHGDIAIYAHPFWSHVLLSDIIGLKGLTGMEIFNYSCEQEWKSGVGEVFFDHFTENGKFLWCFGSDDAHGHVPDFCGGYITVKCESLTADCIFDAIKHGSFYASAAHRGENAPEIYDFRVEDNKAIIDCSPCRNIHLNVSRTRYYPTHAKPGETVTRAEHALPPEARSVRAICVDYSGHVSWTQPIIL